jgi:hypothetical protein
MSDSQEHLSAPELIERVIGDGLFTFYDESHFSWQGCEHCADGLGATVYDLQGYRSLGDTESFDFQVCGDCVKTCTHCPFLVSKRKFHYKTVLAIGILCGHFYWTTIWNSLKNRQRVAHHCVS